MHAYSKAGDLIQLKARIEEKEAKLTSLRSSILETDRKLSKLKELSVFSENYHQNKKYNTRYTASKNKESFYQTHESEILLYESAARFIRSKGLNPDEVTPEKITDTISKLTSTQTIRTTESRALQKELKGLKKQMDIIETYLKEHAPDTKKKNRSMTPEKNR